MMLGILLFALFSILAMVFYENAKYEKRLTDLCDSVDTQLAECERVRRHRESILAEKQRAREAAFLNPTSENLRCSPSH